MSSDAQAAFGESGGAKQAGTLGYWLAGLIAVVAVAGGIGWFVMGLMSLGDDVDELDRVDVPGQATVELEAGKQSVYWEGGGGVPPLEIFVRLIDGPEVTVGPHGGKVTYDVNGRSGRSVAGFEVEQDGRYLVLVGSPREGVVAVGPGVGGRIVSAVVGGLGVFFGGLLLAGMAIIVTARRRRTS